MRVPFLPLVTAAFVLACADVPTTPLLEPSGPNRSDYPPPPWAEVFGVISEDGASLSIAPLMSRSGASATLHTTGASGTYTAWLLVTPGDQAAWLRFTGGTGVTFSNGARIMKANGKVSGTGTVTFAGGGTYQLSSVTVFNASGDCTISLDTEGGRPCGASFEGEGFSSAGSAWTGRLANDGGGDFDGGPPGWDGCIRFDCVCINCVTTTDVKGRGR